MFKVAVIEDEDFTRIGLMYSIDWIALNCSIVSEAKNGVEGIEIIEKHRPDIVIADINMPVMDGLEMIKRTYEQYDYAAIILSGYSNFEYAQKAMQYGVLGYLLKPLDKDELKEAVIRAKNECEVRRVFLDNLRDKQEWKDINLLNNDYNRTDDMIVKKMIEYIYHNYKEKILIQDIVNELNYSETYLNKRFKSAIGTTFIEYLNRYRIQKALELIRDREFPINEIAWRCGIGEYKYFSTVFKKYIGCSPKEYQNKIDD